MLISEEDWKALARHVSTPMCSAPKPVRLALAALILPIDGPDSVTSWVNFDAAADRSWTAWSVWAATSSVLAHVRLVFGSPFYDSAEEHDRRKVATQFNAAWVRPLSSIKSLQLSQLTPRIAVPSGGYWVGFSGVMVFDDGSQAALPEPPKGTEADERQRWDQFIETIRSAISDGSRRSVVCV